MAVGDLSPVPNGFIAKLLKEFGLEWTHLVIISGAVLSSFHLQPYLNSGIWIIGTVASFSAVYLVRFQIGDNFPKYFAFGALATLAGALLPIAALLYYDMDVLGLLQAWTTPFTLYLSVIVGVPVGLCILSYRKQAEFQCAPLSPQLDKAIKDSVSNSHFVHERVAYEIQFRRLPNGDIVLRFDVTMELLNRSKTSATYRDVFDPAGRDKVFLHASVAGKRVNVADRDRLTLRGLTINQTVDANQTVKIQVAGESTFYARDSEIIGVYFPCSAFSVLIRNPPGDLGVHVQSLLRDKLEPVDLPNGDMELVYNEGLLPFQGVRLFWENR